MNQRPLRPVRIPGACSDLAYYYSPLDEVLSHHRFFHFKVLPGITLRFAGICSPGRRKALWKLSALAADGQAHNAEFYKERVLTLFELINISGR